MKCDKNLDSCDSLILISSTHEFQGGKDVVKRYHDVYCMQNRRPDAPDKPIMFAGG